MKSIASILGFTLVTLSAYACWAFASSQLGSPMALYIACSIVFLLLGPLVLYPRVKDVASRKRFFTTFLIAFIAYAALWSLLWSTFHDKFGEIFGSLLGLAAMASVFHLGVKRPVNVIVGTALLFLFHTAGYHLGELFHQQFALSHTTLARLGWGLCHGLGFGIGLVTVLRPSTPSGKG